MSKKSRRSVEKSRRSVQKCRKVSKVSRKRQKSVNSASNCARPNFSNRDFWVNFQAFFETILLVQSNIIRQGRQTHTHTHQKARKFGRPKKQEHRQKRSKGWRIRDCNRTSAIIATPKIHAQYDWTTGAPDNGNEWRKFRAVPRSYPLHPLVLYFA